MLARVATAVGLAAVFADGAKFKLVAGVPVLNYHMLEFMSFFIQLPFP